MAFYERKVKRVYNQESGQNEPSNIPLTWKKIQGTTAAGVGTQSTHAHGLGYTPTYVIIVETSNGVVYISAVADATNIYVKGSAASLTFDAYLAL